VYIDVQRPAHTANDGAFFYAIAQAIQRDAQTYRLIFAAPVREAFQESPFEAFPLWLESAVFPQLQDFTLLLTLDEFEKAGTALAAGRLSPQVFDELRHLIQHETRLAVLLAGVQTLDELGPQWASYFPNVRQLTMSYLAPAEAEALIRTPDPAVEFPLTFSDEAVARILAQTRGHPYLVQLIGSCVVEEVNRRTVLRAELNIVRAAETLSLERGEPYFRNVWDEFTGLTAEQITAGRAFLKHLANDTSPTLPLDPVTLAACQRLERHHVIERVGADYQFEVPLIARWVKERGMVE
jgi:hypothetical protein